MVCSELSLHMGVVVELELCANDIWSQRTTVMDCPPNQPMQRTVDSAPRLASAKPQRRVNSR